MSRLPSETDQTQTITTQSQDRSTLNLNMPREVKLVLVVLGMVALIGGWFVLTGQPGQNDAGVNPVTPVTSSTDNGGTDTAGGASTATTDPNGTATTPDGTAGTDGTGTGATPVDGNPSAGAGTGAGTGTAAGGANGNEALVATVPPLSTDAGEATGAASGVAQSQPAPAPAPSGINPERPLVPLGNTNPFGGPNFTASGSVSGNAAGNTGGAQTPEGQAGTNQEDVLAAGVPGDNQTTPQPAPAAVPTTPVAPAPVVISTPTPVASTPAATLDPLSGALPIPTLPNTSAPVAESPSVTAVAAPATSAGSQRAGTSGGQRATTAQTTSQQTTTRQPVAQKPAARQPTAQTSAAQNAAAQQPAARKPVTQAASPRPTGGTASGKPQTTTAQVPTVRPVPSGSVTVRPPVVISGSQTPQVVGGSQPTVTTPAPDPVTPPPIVAARVPKSNAVPELVAQAPQTSGRPNAVTGQTGTGSAAAPTGAAASAGAAGSAQAAPPLITVAGTDAANPTDSAGAAGTVVTPTGATTTLSPLEQLLAQRQLSLSSVVLGPTNTAVFRTAQGFVVVEQGQPLPDNEGGKVVLKEVKADAVTLALGNTVKTLELEQR
ncbi:MAG: hypothetical protein Q4C89_12750 [Deinococcus sp.]|uniref:hypothetical protein n=1 Tax=Deinococcus sp. TaxID=47478 RepID=UPI0026DBD75A|nr:hypothetical protein [Deinococcus sp.]MDO4246885.1 hypothetical protein [Deinococcus sp.]